MSSNTAQSQDWSKSSRTSNNKINSNKGSSRNISTSHEMSYPLEHTGDVMQYDATQSYASQALLTYKCRSSSNIINLLPLYLKKQVLLGKYFALKSDDMNLGIELASDCATEAFNIGDDLAQCEQSVSLEEFQQSPTEPVPLFIMLCVSHMENHGFNYPGIYRKSGNKAQVKNIIHNFQSQGFIDFSAINVSMYTIGAALKQYLAWMPPLLTKEVTEDIMHIFTSSYNVPTPNPSNRMSYGERYSLQSTTNNVSRFHHGNSLSKSMLSNETSDYPCHNQNFKEIDHTNLEEVKESKIRRILCHLPSINLSVLSYVLEHLSRVALYSEINQMTAKNLSLCFWPTLFPLYTVSTQRNLSKDINIITDILEFLISKPNLILSCKQ